MSYTITTDVFCDGCNNWDDAGGASSMRIEKREAWKGSKSRGWTRKGDEHFCPACSPIEDENGKI